MIGKNELYFAKRDLEFCPVGMAAFILLFLPLIFPAGFRSYDWVPHIGVISSSQTCLSAGPDNCTERGSRKGGRGEREWEEDTDGQACHIFSSPPVFSHWFDASSSTVEAACGFYFTVEPLLLELMCLLKLNISTWNKNQRRQIWCVLISRVRFNNSVGCSLLKSNVSYWPL